jgi:hypothetical protein
MELSLAGLVGAFVGLVAGWINFLVIVGIVERRLRQLDKSATQEERLAFEQKLGLMRRMILALDVVVFSVVGYAIGHAIGG